MTTPLGAAGAADTSLKGATSQVTKGLGKDAFLQLLVASMRYQDPSKPTDSQAYMAQLAQFTQVEKLDQISSSQADATRWQRTVAGQGMLGCTVTGGKDANGASVSGVVVGVTLTSSGARVQLHDGRSLSVDEVTKVDVPGLGGPPASAAASGSGTTSGSGAGTTGGTAGSGGTGAGTTGGTAGTGTGSGAGTSTGGGTSSEAVDPPKTDNTTPGSTTPDGTPVTPPAGGTSTGP